MCGRVHANCLPGKFAQTSVFRDFTGDPSHWHNSSQDGLWSLASSEVTPPPQVDKDGLTRRVIPGLGGYLSGAGWGLSLYLGKVSPFLHTHGQVQILGRGSQATLLGERSMTGSGQAANREPWNTASSPLQVTKGPACWRDSGSLCRAGRSEFSHTRREGAVVFIHQLSFATSGQLLLVRVLMPLNLPPAHGQAKLSKAAPMSSGKEMLVARGWGGSQSARKWLG